jgi:hypothetical protein
MKKLILVSTMILAMLTVMTVGAYASSSSTLDQCRNGGINAAPAPCNSLGTNSSWVNGNLNGNQAHYAEGQFIPYRIILGGLSTGTHNVQIEYAVTKGTKHAIDYLGTFSYTETLAKGDNPCGDIIPGCNPASPTSTIPVPSPALSGFPAGSGLNTFSGAQILGTIALWNGTFTSPMTYVFQNVIDNGDFKTQISLNFSIPAGSNGVAVLSWGGHVAAAADWGVGNSSSAITGSPYHMINVLLDGKSPGSQDRSLATSAVLPTLTVYKFVNNDASPNPLSPSSWTMNVSGCLSNCSFPGNSSGTDVSLTNSYNVNETGPSGYNATFSSGCSGPFPGGGVALTCVVNNNFTKNSSISLAKSASPTTYNAVGQIITYTYNITNTGNNVLSGPFTVNDNQTGTISPCGSGPLNPGGSTSCTSTYSIKQSDIDNKSVTNAATASGNGLNAGPVTTTVTAITSSSISLAKTASPTTYNAVGQIITYTYTINNTGNTVLTTPFTVTDNQTGTISPCGSVPLNPGASTSCTATYTIKQSDIDNGSVTNAATASPPQSNEANTIVTAEQKPNISLTKTASPTTYNAVGQIITYTYTINNTGNTVLTAPFTVTDNQTGTISPCGSVPLNPGASTSCTATYSIKQSDIDNGSVTNAATASPPQSNETNTTVTAEQTPNISLTKTASPTTYNAVGQIITYTYTINNTGNTVLTAPFTVTDNQTGTISPCGSVPLNPGASTSCTATYTIKQSDIDNGSVTNAATAHGNNLNSNEANQTVTAIQVAHLSFTKSGALNITSGIVNYTINATNDGNVDLNSVNITDPNIALTCSPTPPTPLAPGVPISCSGTYPAQSTPFNTNTTITFLAPPYTSYTVLVV